MSTPLSRNSRRTLTRKTTNKEEEKAGYKRCDSMVSFIRALNSKSSKSNIVKHLQAEETEARVSATELRKSDVVKKQPFMLPTRNLSLTEDQDLPNRTSMNDYVVGKEIGKGAYAIVKIATFKQTGEKFAIKSYDKFKLFDPQRKKNVNREIQILKKLDHPGIVKLVDKIDTHKELNLVMNLICGQSLKGYVKRQKVLVETEARRIFSIVAEAVGYCHQRLVCHRDIKLENILLDTHINPTLIDFGFATCVPHDKKFKLFCGTPSYMAPEIVLRKEYSGAPVDVWALGVLLFVLVTGYFPFKAPNDHELYRKIQRASYVFPSHLSQEVRELIANMLKVDPDERINIKEVLQSPWVRDVEMDQ